MHPLAGVYSAAVTPLKADFSPDLEAIPSLLDFLAGRGCHGILLLGTTGEGPSFSPEERLGILRAALQVRGMLPATQDGTYKILAGTGTPSLTETIALTRSAFDLGYDGVVVLPPYYYRKATDEGLFRYFSELIHKAVPSDGFLLGYHIPGTAGIGFSTDLLARLKDAFPHQFAGIKDSSHDADFARQAGRTFRLRPAGVDRYRFSSATGIGKPRRRLYYRSGQSDLAGTATDMGRFPARRGCFCNPKTGYGNPPNPGKISTLPTHVESTAGKATWLPALACPPSAGGGLTR